MEQEEIVIKKGKKIKQTKQIKLRDYTIVQPDYATTPGAVLIYHQERQTMIHEESCQAKTKTIPGDLLPEMQQQKLPAEELDKKDEKRPTVSQKPSTLQIETPLITPEQLFDFHIAQVRIFQKSDRLLQDQEEPEDIFPDMEQTMENVNKAGKKI